MTKNTFSKQGRRLSARPTDNGRLYHGFHKVRTLVRFTIDNGGFKDLEVIELAE